MNFIIKMKNKNPISFDNMYSSLNITPSPMFGHHLVMMNAYYLEIMHVNTRGSTISIM